MILPAALALLQILTIPTRPLSAVVSDATAPAVTATADAAGVSAPAQPAEAGEAAAPTAGVTYMPGSLVLVPVAAPSEAGESSSMESAAEPARVILKSDAEAKRRAWEQRQKRIWLALSITQSSAAALDAWSTHQVVSSGRGVENNPLLRPFAGNDSIYAAIQVGPLLLDYVGRRMLTSNHAWARRTWWIPQVVGTVVSFGCGMNNLAVYAGH